MLVNTAYSLLPSGLLPSGRTWARGPASTPHQGPNHPACRPSGGAAFPKPPGSPPHNAHYPQLQPDSLPMHSHTLAISQPSNSEAQPPQRRPSPHQYV
jgi:hypothetical protein